MKPTGVGSHVFQVLRDKVWIEGLTIEQAAGTDPANAPRAGVYVSGRAGCTVQGCLVERNDVGVWLASSTGGAVVGNEVCRNRLSGVRIEGGSGHRMWANSLGRPGATDSGNLGCGVEVTRGGTDISVGMEDVRGLFGNYIGRNSLHGISVVGAGGNVLIQGNEVSANGGDGVWVEDSPGVRVGTQPTDQVEYASRFGGNLIVNNGGWGVAVRGTQPDATPGLVVMANRIGITKDGADAGNIKGGIWLGGSVADAVKDASIAFWGTFKDANDAHNWNVISFNKGPGVMLAPGCQGAAIQGNVLERNHKEGLLLAGSRNCDVVGNQICRNQLSGVRIEGGSGHRLWANSVGKRDATDSGNLGCGVEVTGGGTDISVGMEDVRGLFGNYIGRNTLQGIAVVGAGGKVLIQGNEVSANGGDGVWVEDSPGVRVGTQPTDQVEYASRFGGNLIVNNGGWGVAVRGTRPDATPGLVVMANRIGGTAEGAGNAKGGVWLGGSVADAVKGAWIAFQGTFKDANDAHNWNAISFNKGPGVMLASGSRGTVVRGNRLAHNQGAGVVVEGQDSRGHSLLANRIWDHERWPGIDLGGDLVTKNDDLDTDDGPNGLQNFPVLEAAQTKADWGTFFRGRLKSAPNGEFLLQFFANTASVGGYFAGEDFLGQQTVRTDAAGNASFVFGTLRTDLGYLWITATATDKDGNTSEFSGGVKVETASDGDSDGVADLLENGAPNNGDGNRDGVPDGQQANVVSYQVIEPGGADAFLTLASAPNTTLKARVQAPTPAGLPSGVRCPLGLQQVEVKCAAGSDQCIETILPAGTQYSTFYRYGPTADDSQPHWYEFKYDGATGAFLQYGRVKQWIRDGGRGDDDGTANGVISCTGGVATDSSVLNAAPGVARIQDRTVEEGGTLGPIRCEIGDPDTPETDCQVTARCESLIPNDNITVGGSGTERDLTLRSVLGQTGTTTVTVGVSDGTSTVTTSYRVTVTARPGSLYTTVEPSAAAADGCKAEPAQAERPVGSKVAVSATEAGAWNFLLWTGAASGFEPTTDVTVTGLGMEAVAHFVKPVLTLGAGGLPQHYCPQSPDLAQDVQVMNLTLSVNEEAAWLVTSIRFQGSGANGHEVNDLEAVKLYKGGTLLSQGTYGADDGFIELGVNQQVPPGGSLNLQLKYQFRENTLTNPPWAKQFAVQTKVDWVNAKPDLPPYPNYAKLPPTLFSVPAVLIAPVWNLNTGEGFGTIQRAIDDPDTANGHTLEVCPGLYVENVRVNKELAIKSKVGPSRTIVQAADTNQDVFSVSANNVIIEGFTIRGADGIDSLGPTAGVDVSGARDFALRKCVVEANAVGAALHWSERCIIADNALRANLFDGLWIAEGKSILVHGNEMAGDGASDQGNQGCGIRVEGGREVYVGYERVDRSILSQNTIKGNRLWGIAVLGSELAPAMEVFIGCNAISNNGRDGVWIEEASQVTVGDARTSCGNLIVGNGRDGVYINASSTVSVLGNRIGEDASGAAPNKGAGVSVADSSDVKVGGPAATPGKEPGNVIVNNEKGGIVIWARTEGKSARNTVEGNLVGINEKGALAPNLQDGIRIVGKVEGAVDQTRIGGLEAKQRNVISGNTGLGISLESGSQKTEVYGNFIGTTLDGTGALGNRGGGVLVLDSPANMLGSVLFQRLGEPPGNVISGNLDSETTVQGERLAGHGVLIMGPKSTRNVVDGNIIGLNRAGEALLSGEARNAGAGVRLAAGAADNTVGVRGPPLGNGNVISGNGRSGIEIAGQAKGNQVNGNDVGLNLRGQAVGNQRHGVFISDSGGNIIGSSWAGGWNVISGNQQSGVLIEGTTSEENLVSGNCIGTDPEGKMAVPNQEGGVRILEAKGNWIGGELTQDTPLNLISGNREAGVSLNSGANNNRVAGNWIGADATGKQALPNENGVVICLGACANVVGGETAKYRNLIAGNAGPGVALFEGAANNRVMGNWIGTDVTGLAGLGNLGDGVYLEGAGTTGTIIGGLAIPVGTAPGNVIAGNRRSGGGVNDGNGVAIAEGASQNEVKGNLVGLGADGATALGNAGSGIWICPSASENLIGADEAGAWNVIGANREHGILLEGSGNRLWNNRIGTDASGQGRFGNLRGGLLIGGSENTIGGIGPRRGNEIAFNQGAGVAVMPMEGQPPQGNRVLGNLIYENQGLGIDLVAGPATAPVFGVTGNDWGDRDGDLQANQLLNFPVIQAAQSKAGLGTALRGSLNSAPNQVFGLEFYTNTRADDSGHGEGEILLGRRLVRTDGSGNVAFTFWARRITAVGQFITATATDGDGNTSEFARSVRAGPASDADGDGVPDLLEVDARNGGDANEDGVPDAQQGQVASLQGAEGHELTLVGPPGTKFLQALEAEHPSPATAPPGVQFPVGFIQFQLELPAAGQGGQVALLLPAEVRVNCFYKFGPTADVPEPHWYRFDFNGSDLGAVTQKARQVLHLVDGQKGDDDLKAQGSVLCLGAPALDPSVMHLAEIADQVTQKNTPTPAISVTLVPGQMPLEGLTLTANSDKPALTPNQNLVLGGTGANRTLTIAPATDQLGEAAITVELSDGVNVFCEGFVLKVNDAPVAGPDAVSRLANQPLKASVATLLANDADRDGNTLLVTGVTTPSSRGATVELREAWVFYTPPEGFNEADTFSYTVSDGQGGTATGVVSVSVQAPPTEATENVLGVANVPDTTHKRIRFLGIPGRSYQVQATGSLTPPIVWETLGTVVAGPNGEYEFVDTSAGSAGARYYRSVRQ